MLAHCWDLRSVSGNLLLNLVFAVARLAMFVNHTCIELINGVRKYGFGHFSICFELRALFLTKDQDVTGFRNLLLFKVVPSIRACD